MKLQVNKIVAIRSLVRNVGPWPTDGFGLCLRSSGSNPPVGLIMIIHGRFFFKRKRKETNQLELTYLDHLEK